MPRRPSFVSLITGCAGVVAALVLLAIFAGMGVALLVLLGIVGLVTCVPVWFAPVLVARRRGVADIRPLAVFTLVCGWTFFGWVAALIWAANSRPAVAASAGE
ncbi:hypothetical protein GCM10017786_10150 [Amycolatopsis deserti]|uniref:Superinfection immunity protein n=1 Tax=Amycolatopsis deserti TaxID=185696 RepID=A0ABQ3IIU0_9PSEU|nr:superinfection immunity protein [Amycolatopsis deserti]GHE81613.1 hypothetical protein GCM10017786_10150 [Amycolatopsis deserti]